MRKELLRSCEAVQIKGYPYSSLTQTPSGLLCYCCLILGEKKKLFPLVFLMICFALFSCERGEEGVELGRDKERLLDK